VPDDRELARLLGVEGRDRAEPARLRDGAKQHAAFVRLLKDNVRTPEQLSERARGMIRAMLDRAEITPSAPWIYMSLTFLEQDGERYAGGTCFVSAEPLGFGPGSISSVPVTLPYPWTDRQQPYHLDVLGLEVMSDEDAQACPEGVLWTMGFGDEVATQVAAFQCRAYRPGADVYAQTDWRPNWDKVTRWYGGALPGDTLAAELGLGLLLDIPRQKPGPKTGTVEKAKYNSREEWHAALRTVALAKPIKTQIKTQIVEVVAGRLSIGGTSISATTVRRYMERFGPKTPEELRNGKWECACHSCKR
jgi:hypothetical protein